MSRISRGRRLVMGLGVIALGVCAALPFRRTSKLANGDSLRSDSTDTRLGADVALQVPGQQAVKERLVTPKPGWPTDEEVPVDTQPLRTPADWTAPKQPPPLADAYRPLFRPEPSTTKTGGHLVAKRAARPAGPLKRLRRHTVHDGDTLEKLAQRYLGNAGRADEIMSANTTRISDRDVLPIGVEIVIPRRAEKSHRPTTNRVKDAAEAERPSGSTGLVPLPSQLRMAPKTSNRVDRP